MQQNWFALFFVMFMVFVSVERLWETFKHRPTIQGKLVMRWSFPILMAVHIAIFVGSAVEYFFFREYITYWVTAGGVVMYVASLVLRNLAIRSLGKFWSLHVEIRDQHQLVTEGIYSFVRHPAYLAVMMELISVPLVANAYWMLLMVFVVYIPLLLLRLMHEEKALLDKFGDRYRLYQREVGRLLPNWSAIRRTRPVNRGAT